MLFLLSLSFFTSNVHSYGDDLYYCPTQSETTYQPPTVWAPTDGNTQYRPTTSTPCADCDAGTVELVGGAGPHEGNVWMRDELGRHGTILSCEDQSDGWCKYGADYVWSCTEANVVCRQLGYPGAETYSVNHKYGMYTFEDVFVWKNVLCAGYETGLMDCDHEIIETAWTSLDGRIAGVSCIKDLPTSTTNPTTSTTEVATTTTSATNSSCPNGWMNAGPLGCFWLHANISVDSWYEANLLCEDLGGFVVEPRTEEIQLFLSTLLTMLPEVAGLEDWWVGLTDTGHEGSWLWVHEAEFADQQFWAPSSPESEAGNDLDCATMSQEDGYLWRDMPCTSPSNGVSMGVICQY